MGHLLAVPGEKRSRNGLGFRDVGAHNRNCRGALWGLWGFKGLCRGITSILETLMEEKMDNLL